MYVTLYCVRSPITKFRKCRSEEKITFTLSVLRPDIMSKVTQMAIFPCCTVVFNDFKYQNTNRRCTEDNHTDDNLAVTMLFRHTCYNACAFIIPGRPSIYCRGIVIRIARYYFIFICIHTRKSNAMRIVKDSTRN